MFKLWAAAFHGNTGAMGFLLSVRDPVGGGGTFRVNSNLGKYARYLGRFDFRKIDFFRANYYIKPYVGVGGGEGPKPTPPLVDPLK